MWLKADNHWLNMTHALVVDDDATSTPQAVSVVFPGDVKRTLTGMARQEVLAWLEQESHAPQWIAGETLQALESSLSACWQVDGVEMRVTAPDAAGLREAIVAVLETRS